MGYLDAAGDRGTLFPKDRCIVSFDGTHIAYTIQGQATGPVIALCAGFVCPDTFWTYLAPELSRCARVLIWNYRGAGVSGMPREPGFRSRGVKVDDFAIEKYAKDLETILDHEGFEEVVLLGHSMGTQVCLEAYRLMPERVKAFISISGPYSSPVRTFYNFALFPKVFAALRTGFRITPRPAERIWSGFFKTPLPYLIARRTGAISAGCKRSDMASYFEHMGALDPLIMMKIAEAMHRHSAEDLLRKIKVPSLIIVGSEDRFTPAWLGRVMASRIPVAEQVIVEGGSHAAIIEQPELVNDSVIDFLTRHGVVSGSRSKRVRSLRSAHAPTRA
ncbi:MAG: alpha/beta fold hydrolase [Actinomycetota bacterium]